MKSKITLLWLICWCSLALAENNNGIPEQDLILWLQSEDLEQLSVTVDCSDDQPNCSTSSKTSLAARGAVLADKVKQLLHRFDSSPYTVFVVVKPNSNPNAWWKPGNLMQTSVNSYTIENHDFKDYLSQNSENMTEKKYLQALARWLKNHVSDDDDDDDEYNEKNFLSIYKNLYEIYLYKHRFDVCEKTRIKSVLMNKYGSSQLDFEKYFDEAQGFKHDIDGIYRIEATACKPNLLKDKASSSIVHISNPMGLDMDHEILTLGHNNKRYYLLSDIPDVLKRGGRLKRVWHMDEDGGDGLETVTVEFNLKHFKIDKKYAGQYLLLIDPTADHDFTDAMIHSKGRKFVGDKIMFSEVPVKDGYEFTLLVRYLKDEDGDGIPSVVELMEGSDPHDKDSFPDADNDGMTDYLEDDSDNDGLPNRVEFMSINPFADFDKDGIPNYSDADSNGTGQEPDCVDSNYDSICDSWGLEIDTDQDGKPNFLDADDDGDTVLSAEEGNDPNQDQNPVDAIDTDSDGIPNYLDTDDDGDDIDTKAELGDSDQDTLPDYLESDKKDTDGDGQYNTFDNDDDGDGTVTAVELGSNPLQPKDEDSNGIFDYLDPAFPVSDTGDSNGNDDDSTDDGDSGNNDGSDDDSDDNGNSSDDNGDSNDDGNSDDDDSNDDGNSDDDGDSSDDDNGNSDDMFDPEADADGDGLKNGLECPNQPCVDTDGDSLPNYKDADDDNDKVLTLNELNDTDQDSVPDYLEPLSADLDQDGLSNQNDADDDGDNKSTKDEVGPSFLMPVDADGDTIPDYLDPDDVNTAATADGTGDSDKDGLSDKQECLKHPCEDSDYDGLPNYNDPDDDNDGTATEQELMDTDADSVSDHLEPNTLDTDGDGLYNFEDDDDDGDNKPTLEEVGDTPLNPIHIDNDGIPAYLDSDSNNNAGTFDETGDTDMDGLSDLGECPFKPCPDTDEDGRPNYHDPDDDNDDLLTQAELGDTDADRVPDYLEPNTLDTDSDQLFNHVDADDDNDGINTIDEVGSTPLKPLDSDADGIPDYLDSLDDGTEPPLDSDSDSLIDMLECPNKPCVDTDLDGLPNFQDPDDDNDSIPTIDEKMDSDQDSLPDYLEPNNVDTDIDGVFNHLDDDDDGDTRPTIAEVGGDILNPLDLDQDNIPDYLDPDSTNEAGTDDGSGDSDGDGLSDMSECPALPCADNNDNGVPDYLEDPNRQVGGDGEVTPTLVTNTNLSEGGSVGLYGLLAVLMILVMKRSTIMPRRKLITLFHSVSTLVFLGVVNSSWANEDGQNSKTLMSEISSFSNEGNFLGNTKWYTGFSLGYSRLKPDTNDVSLVITDKNDVGYKFFAGFELLPNILLETSFNLLGSAQASLAGAESDVDYNVMSFDGLYRFPRFVENLPLETYGIVGMTVLDNDSDVPVEKDSDVQLKMGLGVEYLLKNSFVLRGTMEKFSGDTAFVSAGVVRYFGGNRQDQLVSRSEEMDAMEFKALEVEAKDMELVVLASDQDQDGVLDDIDRCPNTFLGLSVDEQGCGMFNRSFSNITFEHNSTKLTAAATQVLDELAYEIKRVPHVVVEVQAHTDSTGSSTYNIWLSNKRAEAIVSYLLLHGLPQNRLIPRGYGETMPIASNKTVSGRTQNRRAEFKVLNVNQEN